MRACNRRTMIVLGFTLVASVGLSACGSSRPEQSSFVLPAPPAQQTEYVLQPGDAIDVRFYYHPDNNQDNLLVRPDGKVLLPLTGEMQAAGLTLTQLGKEIERRTAANLRDPKVAVNVRTLNQNHVFVGGEVAKPGFVNFAPGLTAIQAIMQSGGWKDTADLKEVVLLQRIGDSGNEYRPSKINLAKVIELGDVGADLVMAPSDILVLPKTGIARANLWMQQYVINMIPIRISASPF